jgi:nucleotide-binding universal stress UspA family protein
MYKHILIPTDGSDLSNKAIRHAIALAKASNAKVTGITVTIPFHVFAMDPDTVTDTADSYKKRTNTVATKYLTQLKDAAAAAGVACAVIHAEHEHPYQAIIDAASKNGCDLIAMASHGRRGISAVVLGSETVKVLTHSKIPVLVYR